MSTHREKVLWGVGAFVLLLVSWELVVRLGGVSDFFLPSPLVVAQSLIKLFTSDHLLQHTGISLARILIGFVAAVITAIPLGVLLGLNRRARAAIEPLIDFVRYTPVPAFIPLFILWFGIGETEKAIVIFSSVFFQLVPMTVNSVSLTPRELIESAETLGASRWQIVTRVLLPYSLPRIWDDLRVSMGWAWSVLLIAEIVGASAGLGYVILQAQRLLQTGQVIAVIAVIGILGLLTDFIFRLLGQAWFPWVTKTTDRNS